MIQEQAWPCTDCGYYHEGTTIVETAVPTKKGGPEIWTDSPMWRDDKGQWQLAGCEVGYYPTCKGCSEPRHRALTPGADGQRPQDWQPREVG